MKKNSLLFICSLLFSATAVVAQTEAQRAQITRNYDLQKLRQLEQQYSDEFHAEKAEALRLAAINGWEEIIELPEGGIAVLVGVFPDGTPKYYQTHNREAGITTRTDRVQTGGAAGLDLNGEGMTLGVWDGGIVRSTHNLFSGRVVQIDNPNDLSDHATHVSGTMIGTGDVINGLAKGMAPAANLRAFDFSNDTAEMFGEAADGLLVSNHSYGLRIETLALWQIGYYDSNSRSIDLVTYNSPYYLPVVSAGNDRQSGQNPVDGGYDYLTDKGVAKNVIVCAASFEVLNYTGPSSVVMSSFSSWGPTDDGRIKPDLTGKGVNTYSSTAVSDNSFANLSGTSMSTPNISGSLILLQQHYNNLNQTFMLNSTLRGLALHTADEAGTSPGPDYRFGWGLMNTEKAAEVITNNGDTSLIIEEELEQDEVYTMTITADGINTLMVSITWTDLAGVSPEPGIIDEDTPMLVNDLDLRISVDGGETFFPWILDGTNPSAPATTGDNFLDNIEKIEIPEASGEYIVTVGHKGSLTTGAQTFSMIVTGISDFTLGTNKNTIEGLALYPNPTSSVLNVEARTVIDSVEITNVLGQTLMVNAGGSNKVQLNTSGLSAGNYFARITSQNNVTVKQFVKN
ncbi:S8 family serine peptidase [Aequorivita echinoideorum]|uniref:S8 family serine peptidase n=1 Tax=Aequorivita echinoideorum TaxID=1549647 RepID=A0ABS5S5H0_9FLAO|nr:S8 family serine peptidase [Aequorivita echinoideorum]MBT0608468.1 S8 family serine peptidase [Aequorivita echinoideorum]